MRVLAENTPGQLVGYGFAGHFGSGVHQPLHYPGISLGRGVGSFPGRVTAAGDVSGHIKDVLGGKFQPGQQAGAARYMGVIVRTKGVQNVANRMKLLGHCIFS